MFVVYSDQPIPASQTKSLFLAGPSPRRLDEADWRHEALAVLRALGYDGTVFVPIPSTRFAVTPDAGPTDDPVGFTYLNQVDWEVAARKRADALVFWVPRVIDRSKEDLGMPGFTTNFEMGEDLASGKLAYGRPASAVKCRYLDERVRAAGLPVHETLESLLGAVLEQQGAGAFRSEGEAGVPLFVWRAKSFQTWYANLRAAGNTLADAHLVNHVSFAGGKFLFSFCLKVSIWVAAEGRFKDNEVIFSRPSFSSVAAFHRAADGTVSLALVKEFRSPVNNAEGFVYELVGGSSPDDRIAPEVNAQHELAEEAGLHIEDVSRFIAISTRQPVATYAIHQASLFAVELTDAEFAALCADAARQTWRGADAYERTYVHVTTLDALMELPVDFTTLGMVFEAGRRLKLL